MNVRMTLAQKAAVLVAVPLAFQICFVGVLTGLLNEAEKEILREQRARAVVTEMNSMLRLLVESAGGVSTRDHKYGERFRRVTEKLPEHLDRLDALVKDNPEEQKAAGKIRNAIEEGMRSWRQVHSLLEKGSYAEVPERAKQLKPYSARLYRLLDSAFEEERKIEANSPIIQAENRMRIRTVLFSGVIVNILIVAVLIVLFNRSTSTRIRKLVENTESFASGYPLHPNVGGADEITQLDESFREMAGKVEALIKDVKDAELKIRLIIESLPVGLLITTSDGTIERVNSTLELMLDRDSHELAGQDVRTLFQAPEELELGADTRGSVEMSLRLNNGDTLPVEVSTTTFDLANENKCLLILADITAKVEVERLKRQFVSIVSHELRTPLSSIKGILEMIESRAYGQLKPNGQAQVGVALRNTDRLLRLINDLLSIDRLQSGLLEMEFDEAELANVVDRSVEIVSNLAVLKSIQIKKEVPALKVFADADRLVQVVTNLLSNAIKYSSENSSVDVSSERNGEWVTVKVRDQGRGIPKDKHKAIFERFVQADPSDSATGSGLGLAISKAIVKEHGGEIGVVSEAGSGSTFWFKIPIEPLDD